MATEALTRPGRLQTWLGIMRTCGAPDPTDLDPIGRWLLISRACVQPMTLTAAAIAGLLAARVPGVRWDLFALSSVGIVVAHASNNMINDYFDHAAGLDSAAYPRTQYAPHPVEAGIVTRAGLRRGIMVANSIDLVIMSLLVFERGWSIAAFALTGLFISVAYVAPPFRLKAKGLGEPSVFVIWGPLMVGGTHLAATSTLPREVIYASVPYALLVTTVLMGKHIDKLEWDRAEKVHTLPVLLGDGTSRRATQLLFVGFYAAIGTLIAADVLSPWTAVALLGAPTLVRVLRTYSKPRPDQPPARYPLWPLWFGPWAFLHARRAGALFVLGLAIGALAS